MRKENLGSIHLKMVFLISFDNLSLNIVIFQENCKLCFDSFQIGFAPKVY